MWFFQQDARLTVGQITWYAQCRYDAIRTGEPAEVLVLSKSREFESFKVYHPLLQCPTVSMCISQIMDTGRRHCSTSLVLMLLLLEASTDSRRAKGRSFKCAPRRQAASAGLQPWNSC